MVKKQEPETPSDLRERYREVKQTAQELFDKVYRTPGKANLTVHRGDEAIFSIPITDKGSAFEILLAISIAATDMLAELL